MDCCMYPNVKLTRARIVKYNINSQNASYSPPRSPPTPAKAEKSAEEIQNRVVKLKNKLLEANENIALLRTWVGQTIDDVQVKRPKSCKEIITELKSLLVSIDDFDDISCEVIQRGQETVKLLDELENQSCYCALNSPSSEDIKKQLQELLQEKDELDDTLNQLLNSDPSEHNQSAMLLLNKAKHEISEMQNACTIVTCSKRKHSPRQSKVLMETGMQANRPDVTKKPKLMQTDSNPTWDQGTNPPCCGSVCKSVQSPCCKKP